MFARMMRVATAVAAGFVGLSATAGDYAVVVSEATRSAEGWPAVVEALAAKHADRGVEVLRWREQPEEVEEALVWQAPRHTCFVARPEEVSVDFVARVHRLTRRLDPDPYGDTLWGILTGFDAANALEIARESAPLTVRKVGAATEVAMEMVEEGAWYSELRQGHMVEKRPGGEAEAKPAPADTTAALVDLLNTYPPELFVTSGHATERDWQIGYSYPNGSFRSAAGRLTGVDTGGREYPVNSPTPKVYLPVGNCLMGHIDGPDAMALAWMNSAGVRQMIGYTRPTWFGYMGWGLLDYFLEQPGRYTLSEAFFANQQALLYALAEDPSSRGLQFDRDVVAFYGDPAWEARMADRPQAWAQQLSQDEPTGIWTFTVTPRRGAATFSPLNTNGSQRGGRPIFALFPRRLAGLEVLEGAEWGPVLTELFLLVPWPVTWDPQAPGMRIRFRAQPADSPRSAPRAAGR